MHTHFAVVCFVGFAAGATAQTTLLVGSGYHPTIATALAVAQAGDEVVVMPGSYPGFTVSVPVTIRSASGGGVVVTGSVHVAAGAGGARAAAVATHLVGLSMADLAIVGGTTTLDQCSLTGIWVGSTALSVQSAVVHLQGCTLTTTPVFQAGHTILATGSLVTAVDTLLQPGPANSQIFWPTGSDAIRLVDSEFHGSKLQAFGGAGFTVYGTPPGVAVNLTNSVAWVSDSTLHGGTHPQGTVPQVCPVVGAGGRFDRCVLQSTCAPSFPLIQPLLGVSRPAPLVAGGLFVLEFHTLPGVPIGVFSSADLDRLTVPLLEQPVTLDAGSLASLALLVADASGFANASWPVPNGIAGLTFWLQAVVPSATQFQLSPVVGGVIR